MAEETQMKKPSLPADYVSIAVLRERWLERQKLKKQQEEEEKAKKEMKCEEDCVDEKKDIVDDCGKGKGKEVVKEGGSDGVEKRGRNMGLFESEGGGYDYVDGVKINVGGVGVGGSRGFRDRRMGKFGGGGYGGDRRRFGGFKGSIEGGDKVVEGYRGDRRRFGRGLGVKGNVVEGKGLKGYEGMRVSEGGDFGGGYREFGRGLGVGKGKNVGAMVNGMDGKVLEGYGNRRVNEAVDFGNLEIGGVRKGRGFGKGESGDVKRYLVDVREGNVVDVKLLEDLGERGVNEVEIGGGFRGLSEVRVDEELEIGGKFRDLLRNGRRGSGKYGRDRGKFAEVLGVGKGENVVEKKRNQNVMDLRVGSEAVKGNVVDGNMLWVSKGHGDRRINEAVDIGKKFGDLKINDGGRSGKSRYGGVRRGFRPRREKFSVAFRKVNEAEKPISVRRENEVEKPNLLDVKGKDDVEKHIPVAVTDKIEVKKQNLVDVTMGESSKGFGHWRRNEAIGGKFGGFSNNGWRKGNGKYGRGRGRFGSWKDKQEESCMMWVKKTDAEA